MRGTVRAKFPAVALATLAIGIAACGHDDGDDHEWRVKRRTGTCVRASDDLDLFLMRKGRANSVLSWGPLPEHCLDRAGPSRASRRSCRTRPSCAGRRAATAQRRVHRVHVQRIRGPRYGRDHERHPVRHLAGAKHSLAHWRHRWDVILVHRPSREPPALPRSRAFRARGVRPRPSSHGSATSIGCRVGAARP